MSTSTSPDPARLRLAQYMDDRRADLRLTWAEVARAAGINRETLRQIRSGTSDIRALTRRAVEDALRWESGSIRTILAGGDPTPLDAEPERPKRPADEIGELLREIRQLAERARRLEEERRESDASNRDEDTA
jgi:transcriptional regulator with XRE-family HTH domain